MLRRSALEEGEERCLAPPGVEDRNSHERGFSKAMMIYSRRWPGADVGLRESWWSLDREKASLELRRIVRFGSSASVRLVVSPALLVAGVRAHVERLRGRHRSRGALELADGVLFHRAHELDAGLDVFEPWGASTGTVGEGKEEGDEEENRQNRVPQIIIITWKKETSRVSHLRRRCRRSAARPSGSRRVRRGTRSPPRARASWPSPARRRSLGCRTA